MGIVKTPPLFLTLEIVTVTALVSAWALYHSIRMVSNCPSGVNSCESQGSRRPGSVTVEQSGAEGGSSQFQVTGVPVTRSTRCGQHNGVVTQLPGLS
jgi:hypothetical protein